MSLGKPFELEILVDHMNAYLHLVLVARLDAGVTSLSWRVKEALEAQGHTVFLFAPERWSSLFDESGVLDLGGLARFLDVERPDAVLMCDGLGVKVAAGDGLLDKVPLGALVADAAELKRSVDQSTPGALGFALAAMSDERFASDFQGSVTDVPGAAGSFEGVPVFAFPPCPDTSYLTTPLANDVACPTNVMCLQDATPARVAFMRELAGMPEMAGAEVCCFGRDWPADLQRCPEFTAITYAARSSLACVAFEDEDVLGVADGAARPLDRLQNDMRMALVAADGAAPARVCCAAPAAQPSPAEEADLNRAGGLEKLASLARQRGLNASAMRARKFPVAYEGPVLEDGLSRALSHLRRLYASRGLMPGVAAPRCVVCVLGYFGMGNFGDEYILASISARLRERIPGCVVVAVGENPAHTLQHRGIVSLTMADKHALGEVLSHCSASLVAAGLLFDQGIRWTMGRSELLSDMPHTDIPGIAAFVELAWLNECRTFFYCAGAGPLDVAPGRTLVRLMGKLDARFLVRDEQTERLIVSCGVPAEQVSERADAAFLGKVERTVVVQSWLVNEGIDLAASRLVAVSLREYENAPRDFAARIAKALDRVANAHPDVVFAACLLDPSDASLAEAVQAEMTNPERLHVFDPAGAVEPMADLLSRSSAGLSMRYHCALLLGAFGVPCVGLGYLPKVVSLYQDLGQADTLLEMDADASQVSDRLERVLAEADTRAEILRAHVEALRARTQSAEDELVDWVCAQAPAKCGAIGREFFLRTVPASALEGMHLAAKLEAQRQSGAQLSVELDAARAEVRDVRASWSYRIGNALVQPLAALKRALKKG